MNQAISPDDREWRLHRYYIRYHLALGRAARLLDPALILAIHSFTRHYESDLRDFEIGVLCTTQDTLAARIEHGLRKYKFDTRINMPWSGIDGFMYAADSLMVSAQPGRRKAVMIELRNDLLVDPTWRARAVHAVARTLEQLGHETNYTFATNTTTPAPSLPASAKQ